MRGMRITLTALMVMAAVLVPATPTAARVSVAHLDGVCHVYANGYGDTCLYSADYAGLADFFVDDCDLYDNHFFLPGGGTGDVVADNVRVVHNTDRFWTVAVYLDAGCGGAPTYVPPDSAFYCDPPMCRIAGLRFVRTAGVTAPA